MEKPASRDEKIKCEYLIDRKCDAARRMGGRNVDCPVKEKDLCCFFCVHQMACSIGCLEPFPPADPSQKVTLLPTSKSAGKKWKYALAMCLVGVLVITGTFPLGIPVLSPVHAINFSYGAFSGSILVTVSPTFSFSGISRPFIVSVRGGSGSFHYVGKSYEFTTPVGGRITVHETRLVWGGAPITGIYIVAGTEVDIKGDEETVSPSKLVYSHNDLLNWQTINVIHRGPFFQFDSMSLTFSIRYSFSVIASLFAGSRTVLKGSIELGTFTIRITVFPILYAITSVLLLVTAVTYKIMRNRSKPKAEKDVDCTALPISCPLKQPQRIARLSQ